MPFATDDRNPAHASSMPAAHWVKTVRNHPFAYSSALCLVAFIAIAMSRGIVFDTVDDYNMMMTISGEKTGDPYFQLTFFNSAFGFLMSLLYRITDSVQWYSIVELSFLLAGLSVIGGCLVRITPPNRSVLWPTLILAALLATVYLYPVQRMQFTTTAATLGAASCALCLCIGDTGLSTQQNRRYFCLSLLFLALAFIERKSAGICCSVFWLLCVGRILLYSKSGFRNRIKADTLKWAARPLLAALLVVACFYGFDTLLQRLGDNSSYGAYNQWRIEFQDHVRPSYEEAPDMYLAAGWSEEVFNLARSLIYVDEAIDTPALEHIVQSPETATIQPSIRDAISLGYSLFKENETARGDLVVVAGLGLTSFLAGALLWRRNRRSSIAFCSWTVVVALVSFCLCLYLCLSGRWLLRLFLTVALPAASCFLFQLVGGLNAAAGIPNRKIGKHGSSHRLPQLPLAAKGSMAAVLAVSVLFGSVSAASDIEKLRKRDSYSIPQMAAIENYALQHPDDVFVHDYSVSNSYDSYDPFRTYDGDLTNLIISGGSYTRTGAYNKQLEANGIDGFLDGRTLLSDNVYYISNLERGDYVEVVSDYLESKYGPVNVELVDVLNGTAGVYKFSLSPDPSPILDWEQTLPLRNDDTGVL